MLQWVHLLYPRKTKLLGGILVSLRPSVRASVRPSVSVCSWWHPVVWILLLYPMDLLHHLEKGKEELLPLQYHIKSLHIISRHYKKSLLRSPIYLGYEELSTDTSYPIWRRQKEEASMRCSLLHGSWDQILQRRPSVPHPLSALRRSVMPTVLVGSISYLYILSSNPRRSSVKFLAKFKNLNFWQFFLIRHFDFVLFWLWDLMWITSMGSHGAAGGILERRRSSCSSCGLVTPYRWLSARLQYLHC